MIFVDTGAWIALTDKSDQYHQSAIVIYAKLKQQRERFLTTDYVIGETVTRLRYDAGHAISLRFLDLMSRSERSGIIHIIRVDESLFANAVDIFRRYNATMLSFTDCVSFAVCQKYALQKAFAFDEHFSMMGFELYH